MKLNDTLQANNQTQKSSFHNIGQKIIDLFFIFIPIWTKIISIPILCTISFFITILTFIWKICQLAITFFMNGIQGVQHALRITTFAQKIHYAILKKNGQYLKLQNKTLEEIFTCQLYDYGIRKFMSISQIQQDTKVTQIQFWSNVGLNFIKQKFGVKQVSALTNSHQKISRFKPKLKQININQTDYSTQHNTLQKQDIFIFFNRSRQNQIHQAQIDMIKILGYIKKNLTQSGYIVIGNYFNYIGDVGVFQQLLDGFGFKIMMKQDITLNINQSRKVLSKIYKNRLIPWTIGKIKNTIYSVYQHHNFISNSIRAIWNKLQQLSGLPSTDCKYYLFIVQHAS